MMRQVDRTIRSAYKRKGPGAWTQPGPKSDVDAWRRNIRQVKATTFPLSVKPRQRTSAVWVYLPTETQGIRVPRSRRTVRHDHGRDTLPGKLRQADSSVAPGGRAACPNTSGERLMASPRWKIHDARNRLVATAVSVEVAAACACFYGAGARVKDGWNRRAVAVRLDSEDSMAIDDVIQALRRYEYHL